MTRNKYKKTILSVLKHKAGDKVFEVYSNGFFGSLKKISPTKIESVHVISIKPFEVSYNAKFKKRGTFVVDGERLFKTKEEAQALCDKLNSKILKENKREKKRRISELKRELKKELKELS